MATIQVKRGTRAQLNSAASIGWLKLGELYLITDENVLSVGTSTTTYEDVGPGGESLSASAPELITGLWTFNTDLRCNGLFRVYESALSSSRVDIDAGVGSPGVFTGGSNAMSFQVAAFNHANSTVYLGGYAGATIAALNGDIELSPAGGVAKVFSDRILTVADEGPGNGLDADTLDGIQASEFMPATASVTNVGSTSGTTAVGTTDTGKIFYATPAFGSTRTFRLDASSVGTQVAVARNSTGTVEFSQGTNQTIISSQGEHPAIKTNKTMATAACLAANVWMVTGDLTT